MESGEMDLLSKKAILSLPRDVEKSLDGKILDEYINVKNIEALPTVQSQSTAGQLNGSAQSTNLIDRQAAIDGKISIQCANGVEIYSDEAVPVEYLKNLPSVQPEPCEDAVSRQGMIDTFENRTHLNWENLKIIYPALEIVESLPPVTPVNYGSTICEDAVSREFVGIVVEYPSISTYKEFDGKPYFSIKYIEKETVYIGFGTYKPEVLSEYIREYFMPPVAPAVGKKYEVSIKMLREAILATNTQSEYDSGLRNGFRFALAVLTGEKPEYETYEQEVEDLPSVQPVATDTNVGDTISRQDALDILDSMQIAHEQGLGGYAEHREQMCELPPVTPAVRTGHWIQHDPRFPWSSTYKCTACGNYLNFSGVNGGRGDANFCPNCGAKMKGEPNETD